MRIPIDPSSSDPIYEQIRSALAQAILAGEVLPGEPLPSIRALARDLRVSVITTTRAYSELVAEGLADSVQGKGVFVRAQDPREVRARAEERIAAAFADAARAADLCGIAREELHALLDHTVDEKEER
ncbi:GntR family transcriptional regulator [Brachybacterium sp. JHP9]|uniref:GntR family transcriptional regulator n=1 Tax=Brachybacterium equifaecis TaxID=2910770 RepID=A0ABT0QZQ5_9MICO|nr:GntR family transcriptional regulator [Brachybacterium equifaecis]MCL6423020.1 GntR family transcriptional regulator [Brachybacterium equifaecis]